MPPSNQPPFDPRDPSRLGRAEADHLLPPAHKSSAGPVVGIIIIVVLLVIGALYFWGAHLNEQNDPRNNLPLIPGDTSTTVE